MRTSRQASLLGVTVLLALALWFALRPGKNASVVEKAVSIPTPAEASPAAGGPASVADRTGVGPSTTSTVTAGATSSPQPLVGVAAVSVYAPGVSVAPEESAAPAATGGDAAAPRDAQTDVGKVRVMLRDFHTLAGENPVGTNAEIMSALMGGNARQATLGPPEGMSLNGKGELIDQWSTPYFFHQLSKDVMEIRSAGPDKVLWTQDDVVTR